LLCNAPFELDIGLCEWGRVDVSDGDKGRSVRPRMGKGAPENCEEEGGGLFVTLEIAALRTRASGGFIPQAKHGANGVCALAVAGSKLEGTGFEKEHIGHIQVAVLAGGGSVVGTRNGLSVRDNGEEVALLDGLPRLDTARLCTDDRLDGFGMRVIFGEDFRKPACHKVRMHDKIRRWNRHT